MTDLEALETKLKAERENRRAFLKNASPIEVLNWIMRSPDVEPRTQAYCAKILLENDNAGRAALTEETGGERQGSER